MKTPGTHYREMKMQQTKSYWRFVTMAGLVCAFVASACVVTTSTDDDDDNTAGKGGSGTAGAGTAGSGTAGKAGSSSAGAAGAGTAGTAGADNGGAGPVSFQCDPAEGGAVGTPNSCSPSNPSDPCEKCVQAKCCSEYEACYAYEPGNQCGWGGPLTIAGEPNGGGEALCVQACLKKIVMESGAAPDDSDVGTCANECATSTANGASKECGSVIGVQTSDLVACLRRDCSVACFGA
jgi:hypothetical protein